MQIRADRRRHGTDRHIDGAPRMSRCAGEGIAVSHLSVHFAGPDGETFQALHDVSLEFPAGKVVCLVGPSGCGKSTLLNVIAGLLPATDGEVSYGSKRVDGPNTACGYLTQHDTLLPWARIDANVALGLRVQGVRASDRERLVADALDEVGLTEFARHYPSQLSGGMRKRALLARTVVYRPEVLLMDEPFGALDALMKYRLQMQLVELWERERKTLVFVTHDLDEAILLADEIVVLGTKPGRIVERMTVELPRPRDLATLRRDPQFAQLWQALWDCMGPPSDAATAP